MSDEQHRTYIGDGVYASFDGWNVWLEAKDSSGYTNRIAIDPEVMDALVGYFKRVWQQRQEEDDE